MLVKNFKTSCKKVYLSIKLCRTYETPGSVYAKRQKNSKKKLKILQKSVDFTSLVMYTNIAFHEREVQENNNNWIV